MKVSGLFSLPLQALRIFSTAKDFSGNRLLGSRRLNRRGLHRGRVRLSHRLAKARRGRLAASIPPTCRADFERDGFVCLENFLPPDQFERLRTAIVRQAAPSREMIQGGTVTRRQALEAPPYRGDGAVRDLLDNPLWSGLLAYVGASRGRPLLYVQSILANRLGAEPDLQSSLHADTFHPTVKAWLFLTDVAVEDGPFCYVPGSHRLTPQRLEWEHRRSLEAKQGDVLSARGSPRITAQELAALGLPPPRPFPVSANTLIVADTFGFHARMAATRPALRMEIWAYGRRNPFLPWLGADLLSLPGIAERRIPVMWAVRDRLERHIGQPWLDVGPKRADDWSCHGEERAPRK